MRVLERTLTEMPEFLGEPCVVLEDGRDVEAMMMTRAFAFVLPDHFGPGFVEEPVLHEADMPVLDEKGVQRIDRKNRPLFSARKGDPTGETRKVPAAVCVGHGGWARGPAGSWLVRDGQAFYVLPNAAVETRKAFDDRLERMRAAKAAREQAAAEEAARVAAPPAPEGDVVVPPAEGSLPSAEAPPA